MDQPFYASGNIASAGGCLSSQYLAFFVISKILDIDNAIKAIYYFAPTGQTDIYVDMAISNVKKYLWPSLGLINLTGRKYNAIEKNF